MDKNVKLDTKMFRKGSKWEEDEKVAAVKYLIEDVLKYSKKDMDANISTMFFRDHGLESLLRSYPKEDRNPYKLIRSIYPDVDFDFFFEKHRWNYALTKNTGFVCEKCGISNEERKVYVSEFLDATLCKRCYTNIWTAYKKSQNHDIIIGEDMHVCKLCGGRFNNVINHAYRAHRLTKEEYIKKFKPTLTRRNETIEEVKIRYGLTKSSNLGGQMRMNISENITTEIKEPKEEVITVAKIKELEEKYRLGAFKNLIKTRDSLFLMKYTEMIQAEIDKEKNVEENKCRMFLIEKELKKKFKKESK